MLKVNLPPYLGARDFPLGATRSGGNALCMSSDDLPKTRQKKSQVGKRLMSSGNMFYKISYVTPTSR